MTPDYTIEIGGKDKTALFQDRIKRLEIVDNDGMEADTLTLVLDDRDYRMPIPEFDEIIKIELGYQGQDLVYMGSFAVNETSTGIQPKTLTVRAKSADMIDTLKEPKTRPWHEKTLNQIASEVAVEHGLTPSINEALSGIYFPHINQSEESDMHLLTRLVREHDAMLKIADSKLIIVPKGEGVSASGLSLSTETINLTDVEPGGTISNKGRSKYKGVKCNYRDTLKARTEVISLGDNKPYYEIREPAATKELAEQKAKAKLKELERGVQSLSLTVKGNSKYAAGIKVILGDDFKPKYAGSLWVIKRVRHTLAKRYVTSIEGEPPNQTDSG